MYYFLMFSEISGREGGSKQCNVGVKRKWPLSCILWVHSWLHKGTALSWYTPKICNTHTHESTAMILHSCIYYSLPASTVWVTKSAWKGWAVCPLHNDLCRLHAGAKKFLLRGSAGFLKAIGTQLEVSRKANSAVDWRS